MRVGLHFAPRARHARPIADMEVLCGAASTAAQEEWCTLSLRCALSFKPITDPAKGTACKHLECFNFAALREHMQTSKCCPLENCGAVLKAIRRQPKLRALLVHAPPGATEISLRLSQLAEWEQHPASMLEETARALVNFAEIATAAPPTAVEPLSALEGLIEGPNSTNAPSSPTRSLVVPAPTGALAPAPGARAGTGAGPSGCGWAPAPPAPPSSAAAGGGMGAPTKRKPPKALPPSKAKRQRSAGNLKWHNVITLASAHGTPAGNHNWHVPVGVIAPQQPLPPAAHGSVAPLAAAPMISGAGPPRSFKWRSI